MAKNVFYQVRELLGLSVTQMSDLLRISRTHLHKIERNNRSMPLKALHHFKEISNFIWSKDIDKLPEYQISKDLITKIEKVQKKHIFKLKKAEKEIEILHNQISKDKKSLEILVHLKKNLGEDFNSFLIDIIVIKQDIYQQNIEKLERLKLHSATLKCNCALYDNWLKNKTEVD